jgi:hypothetical protein
MFNATWFGIGQLMCMGSYPAAGLVNSSSILPPPGNISVILTNQCSQYQWGPPPGESTWSGVMTDTWGCAPRMHLL